MNLSEKMFDFTLKTKVKSGIGLTNDLPKLLKEHSFEKIGFVIDGNLYDALPRLSKTVDDCKKKCKEVIVHLYRQEFEPTYQYLDQVKLEFMKGENSLVDCIVGIGGGSSIDTAKGIATLVNNYKPAITYRGFPTNLNPSIPVIAIPSTAGTGTELAFNAVFIDEDSNTKLGINTPNNYPILAILDPEIVATTPRSVAIGSGIGALIRTLETLVTPKANYVSKMFSKEAFKLIINSLPEVIDDMSNHELWSRMQWGAYFSMAALSNSSSGPAGSMSYYLATNFNVPQGLGYGISGVKFARLNQSLGYYGYADLFDTIDHRSNSIVNEREKSEYVVKTIEDVLGRLGVPNSLKSFGLTEAEYDSFCEFSIKISRAALDLNPVRIEDELIAEMLKELIGT